MIRIITDSAADFSQSELQALSVRCVPMTVSFGEDSYTDGVDLPQEIFWQRMEAGQNPKTSQPSPDAFLREFEAAKDAGDSVVCILVSSALSGTVQSALIAAGMVEELDIALVDSLAATAGQRLLVQEACRLRDAGQRQHAVRPPGFGDFQRVSAGKALLRQLITIVSGRDRFIRKDRGFNLLA